MESFNEFSKMEESRAELNLRSKEIQKFLIGHLQLTPRRQLFEEQTKIANKEDLERTKPCESIESVNNFDWGLFNELREFREKNHSECMSSINHQRLQRARENEKEFLEQPCGHRRANNKEVKPFCESRVESSSEVHPQFVPENCGKLPRMKTLRFAPENSLALAHQKFKY